jgi:hypothetical protein
MSRAPFHFLGMLQHFVRELRHAISVNQTRISFPFPKFPRVLDPTGSEDFALCQKDRTGPAADSGAFFVAIVRPALRSA